MNISRINAKPVRVFYHQKGLWLLYLTCAFPLFFWTLLLGFRDISWLAERTNLFDAIGVIAYGMIYAFVESVIWFIVTATLGLLISRCWSAERRAALMGVIFLVLSIWSILEQAYFAFSLSIPAWVLQTMAATGRPVLVMYIIALGLVSLSMIIPAYFILHSEQTLQKFLDFMDSLSTLSILYLFIGFIGLVIIIIRNI